MFLNDHVDLFALLFILIILYKKKTYFSVCGETTVYSTAMGDVLIQWEFNYLLYDMLHMQIG